MPTPKPPYPAAFRQRMVELVGAGRGISDRVRLQCQHRARHDPVPDLRGRQKAFVARHVHPIVRMWAGSQLPSRMPDLSRMA